MLKPLLVINAILLSVTINAQVGFNNPNPHASSVLDLTATDKGLLIPRMTTAQRQAIGSPGQSLLVFDTTEGRFYFYNGGWFVLNEWVKTDGSNNVSLSGNASVTGDISSSTMNMTNLAASNNITTSSLNASSASVSGSVSAGSLAVTGFAANALVPSGVIVMWSGSTASVPAGWALCNGANGTPNLMDRFIVGAGSAYGVGNTGGASTVTLNVNQIPSHTHTYTDVFYSEANAFRPPGAFAVAVPGNIGSGGSDSDNTGYGVTRTSNATGSNQSHENLPPYYSLAYIMKL
ncbi:MAG: hypothetical protein RH948_10870 [Cyclobacteriaceae bacterium]